MYDLIVMFGRREQRFATRPCRSSLLLRLHVVHIHLYLGGRRHQLSCEELMLHAHTRRLVPAL
jgi:hypothetical protein